MLEFEFKYICPRWYEILPHWNKLTSKKRRFYRQMLKNSEQCVVGEAHGWKCGYALSDELPRYDGMVQHCDECTKFSSTRNGIPTRVGTDDLEQIIGEFVRHFETKHM